MRRPINRIMARGLVELDCMAEFAAIVARIEGWRGPRLNHQRRVWQALAENTTRKPDPEWVAAAVRLFAFRERTDLCDEIIGYLQRQRWEGEREREDPLEVERRRMRSVRAEPAERREVAS